MGFTAQPVDGSSPTPLPMPSAVPDGTNTPFVTEGGPAKTTGGNTLAPVATYQYDGYNVVEGVTTDPAVTGDNSGTLSAKLRGLSKILTDIWDSVNHRIKVDGSGVTQPVSGTFWQTTQPVSGTVTANAGTNLNTSALALEAGHLANIDTHTPTQGQATKANSSPVVLASDQGDLLIKGDFTEVAGQAAGSVTGTSTPIIPWTDVSAYKSWVFQMTGTWSMTLQVQFSNDGVNPNQSLFFSAGSSGGDFTIITANGQYYGATMGRWMRIIPTVWTSNASGVGTLELYTLPLFAHTMTIAQGGTWTVQPGNTANTTPWLVSQSTSATGTKSNVASSATSVTILASNASRKGAIIYNDSTQILYLDLSGGTASNSSYSVQVPANGYFEVPGPAIYSGAITGIWAAANGNARCTEWT